MFKVSTCLSIIEIDGKEVTMQDSKYLFVDSYWTGNNKIVLVLPDQTKITVLAGQLQLAIQNAINK